MIDILGKKVKVKVNDAGKRRLGFDVEFLEGEIKEEVDWLVGCPVFIYNKSMLGVGYECHVVEIKSE